MNAQERSSMTTNSAAKNFGLLLLPQHHGMLHSIPSSGPLR